MTENLENKEIAFNRQNEKSNEENHKYFHKIEKIFTEWIQKCKKFY
jgi:hypothetical protein